MIRRLQGLLLVAVLLLAVVPRGSAIMRCNNSGAFYLSGWDNPGCEVSNTSEEDCCGGCGHCDEREIDRDCCDLIGVFEGDPLIQEKHSKLQPPMPLDLPPVEFLEPLEKPVSYLPSHFDTRPDPPGLSLQVAFATFLI